jgi:hypothetical protein
MIYPRSTTATSIMQYPPLPSNRLILNGNKLHNVEQLLSYITHRLKLTQTIVDQQAISQHLAHYPSLTIAIRHSSHFLQDESASIKKDMIDFLSQLATVQMT